MATVVWFDINSLSVDCESYSEKLRPPKLDVILREFEDRMQVLRQEVAVVSDEDDGSKTNDMNGTSDMVMKSSPRSSADNLITNSSVQVENGRKEVRSVSVIDFLIYY